jgi:hypothetical protein
VLAVAESKTVAELMGQIVEGMEMAVDDREHFWLYKFNKETLEITPYESREHVG